MIKIRDSPEDHLPHEQQTKYTKRHNSEAQFMLENLGRKIPWHQQKIKT